MDTRGWSTKNASVQIPGQQISDDRLIRSNEVPAAMQPSEVHPRDDMLDYYNNPVAQTVTGLAQSSAPAARQAAIQSMQPPATPRVVAKQPEPETLPFSQDPLNPNAATPQQSAQPTTSPMTSSPTLDTIRLSQNSDLNVSSLARQAEQANQEFEGEGEISLR
jgi:hypothetical protein